MNDNYRTKQDWRSINRRADEIEQLKRAGNNGQGDYEVSRSEAKREHDRKTPLHRRMMGK